MHGQAELLIHPFDKFDKDILQEADRDYPFQMNDGFPLDPTSILCKFARLAAVLSPRALHVPQMEYCDTGSNILHLANHNILLHLERTSLASFYLHLSDGSCTKPSSNAGRSTCSFFTSF
jgi:hypothetical protein